jgi:hypothetical protein
MVSQLEQQHAPYFVQKVKVGRDLVGVSRLEFFLRACADKRVLHVGCVDWPITDLEHNLHLQLDRVCAQLDGLDINTEAFDAMRPHLKGQLFGDSSEVTGEYDLMLVPEVLEHVGDVAGFLQQLDSLRWRKAVITVPDAIQCHRRHFDYEEDSETFVEVVHPDHNCWYTPYTFTNTIRKYTNWKTEGLYFFNTISLLMVVSRP